MDPNDLLLWMSAKGIGTWGRFRAAVDELQASEDVDQNDDDLAEDAPAQGGFPIHHRLRLNFERLGHAEFFREDFPNGWRVVPPTLACISDELGHIGILCGARTDKVIMGVEERAEDLRLETLAQPECPDRIQVRADKPSQLAQLADAARVHFQPEAARTLLAAIPPIDDSQLETSELPLGNDWDVKRFSAKTLSWATVAPDEARRAPIGLFRIMVHCQPHYYLRLRETTYCVPVQVGKYILL
ncbi:MAG TPA: hypothetical protein VND64_13940, partial [Pirellulales bacterium]|nr:hypothetical protein [Pirellulales bacterium]